MPVTLRRLEPLLIVVTTLALTGLPIARAGWPDDLRGALGAVALMLSGLTLLAWRSHPAGMLAAAGVLSVFGLWSDAPSSDGYLVIIAALAAVAGERFGGAARWPVALAGAAYLGLLEAMTGDASIGLFMLTAPGYLAGTVLRMRREVAEQLAARGRDLEEEGELYAQLSVRNERARIAAELHDIVGHALSVMVVQAAAGQRLVERSPEGAADALAVIAASARQGQEDLQRLVDLLGGTTMAAPDLSLVEEVVERAARSGLHVTCRLEGDREGVDPAVAHMAFRVVQESLTNALRHAPGSAVRVLMRGEPGGRTLRVRVENDLADGAGEPMPGSGRGLRGLAERIDALGGTFGAGPDPRGGWWVEARIPSALAGVG